MLLLIGREAQRIGERGRHIERWRGGGGGVRAPLVFDEILPSLETSLGSAHHGDVLRGFDGQRALLG